MRAAVQLFALAAGPVLLAPFAVLASDQSSEIERLKALVRAQQDQIDELRKRLDAQQKLIEILIPASRAAVPPPPPAPVPAAPSLPDSAPVKGPLTIDIGAVSFTPFGFLDFAQLWRSKAVISGFATNFGAIPFNNTVFGHRRQMVSSAANTRLGVRMNTRVRGVDFLGMVQTDFFGFVPNNVATTANSYGLRLRLAFMDVRKNRWEFLAGQNWSLLTPARWGISPYPESLFLTQDLDPNLHSGLVWERVPQLRVVFHASPTIAMGVSFESGNTYAGGSAGAGMITLPAAFAPTYFEQVDNGIGNGNSVPNPNADLIGKIAFDRKIWSRPGHLEATGLWTRFAFFNPLKQREFHSSGGGVALNASIEALPGLTLFTNNFYTRGGGGFIFGEAPDLIIHGNGGPSLLPAASTVDGLEYVAGKWKFWVYYGGTWIGRISTIDPFDGRPVGYGYEGSPDSQNRTIQQITGGFHRQFWSNPNYGTFQFNGQYSWLVRHPWFVAPGNPRGANLNQVYLGFRYYLPGAPPRFK